MRRTAVVSRDLLVAIACSWACFGCSPFASVEEPNSDAAPAADGGVLEASAGESDAAVSGEPLVLDTFTRTTATGLGAADVGGMWDVGGAGDATRVAGGAAQLVLTPSRTIGGRIGPDAVADVAIEAVISYDGVGGAAPTVGQGLHLAVLARARDEGHYQGKVVVYDDGQVVLAVVSHTKTSEVVVGERTPAGFGLTRGELLHARFHVAGTYPTRLRVKAWKAVDPEPETWQLETTDGKPELQRAGQAGVLAYLSASALAPVTVSLDDLVVRPAP